MSESLDLVGLRHDENAFADNLVLNAEYGLIVQEVGLVHDHDTQLQGCFTSRLIPQNELHEGLTTGLQLRLKLLGLEQQRLQVGHLDRYRLIAIDGQHLDRLHSLVERHEFSQHIHIDLAQVQITHQEEQGDHNMVSDWVQGCMLQNSTHDGQYVDSHIGLRLARQGGIQYPHQIKNELCTQRLHDDFYSSS